MKTKLFPVLVIAAGCVALGARAQVATPTPLAPAADTPAAPQSTPQASQTVYLPRLPAAAELTSAAAAQGLTIDKIVQTTSQMTVVYRTANGQTNAVAYVLLPSSDGSAAATAAVTSPATPAPQVVYTPAPATKVVYYAPAPAAPVYYYDPFYYPSYYGGWYAPVALSVGFGWGYHGGWHGGGGWHGHH